MPLFHQPWHGRMYLELETLLTQSPRFDHLRIAVAFVKRSGVRLLRPALDNYIAQGGIVEVVAGIDHRSTSRQGLEELLQITPNVHIFHDNRQDCTFHPKLYLFERSGVEAIGFVGSSNLTAGGIYSNYELNVRYNLSMAAPADKSLFTELLQVYQEARQHALLLTPALLADIEQRGWLDDEDKSFRAIPNTTTPSQPGAYAPTPPPPSPFPRIPIPTAPRRRTHVTGGSPRPPRTPTAPQATVPSSSTLLSSTPVSTLVINYTHRDISTAGGKSGDFQITFEVRDANPAFWQWESAYTNKSRRTDVVINGVGPLNIRIYENSGLTANGKKQSAEFRVNSTQIRTNAQIGDLLRIDRMDTSVGYEYEFTRIPQNDASGNRNPEYQRLDALCQPIQKRNSTKKYAYI